MEKMNIKQKVAIFTSILSLLTTIISVFVASNTLLELNNYKNTTNNEIINMQRIYDVKLSEINNEIKNIQNSYDIKISELETKIVNIEQNNINNSENSNIISGENNTLNLNYLLDTVTDKDTLLRFADRFYDSKDYKSLLEVYSRNEIKDDPLTLTNMGYLYSNGLGVEENISTAILYYNKAIDSNYIKAYTNKLSLLIREYLVDDIIETLKECYESKNSLAAKFLSIYYDIDALESFYSLSYIDQVKYIEGLYIWFHDENDYVYSKTQPSHTSIIKYVASNVYSYYNGSLGTSGTYTRFKIYKKICENIHLLEEDFIYSE